MMKVYTSHSFFFYSANWTVDRMAVATAAISTWQNKCKNVSQHPNSCSLDVRETEASASTLPMLHNVLCNPGSFHLKYLFF